MQHAQLQQVCRTSMERYLASAEHDRYAQSPWTPQGQDVTRPHKNQGWSLSGTNASSNMLARGSSFQADARAYKQQLEFHRRQSDIEAQMISAIQSQAYASADAAEACPDGLTQVLQDWLEQRVASQARIPSLADFHLHLSAASAPSSLSRHTSMYTPASPLGRHASMHAPTPQAWAQPSCPPDSQRLFGHPSFSRGDVGSPSGAFQPPAVLSEQQQQMSQQQRDTSRTFVRQASSIRPRERREPEREVSLKRVPCSFVAPASASESEHCENEGQPDGMLLLLEACEVLDMQHQPATAPAPDTHWTSRQQQPRSTSPSSWERIKALVKRSDLPLSHRRPAFSSSFAAHKREKLSIGSALAPVKKAAKPHRTRRGRSELHGPCCHCLATDSPQWRKGPKCKPILCNACGTRFLRTRSLGKSSGKGAGKRSSFSPASSCNQEEAEATDADRDLGEETGGHSMTSSQDNQPPSPPAHYHQSSHSA